MLVGSFNNSFEEINVSECGEERSGSERSRPLVGFPSVADVENSLTFLRQL